MPDAFVDIAASLKNKHLPRVRIAVVTAVVGSKVKTDVTGEAEVTTNSDALLAVGDRVLVVFQDTFAIVVARLSGDYPEAPRTVPVGAMQQYAGVSAPVDWLLCDGAAVSRTTYPELFAVCGTRFGAGDGATTFNVPNLTARFALGPGNSRDIGATGGTETVTLTEAQLPEHDHTMTRGGGSNQVATSTNSGIWAADVQSTTTGETGSGAPHPNMPPYIVVNHIIRAR